MIQEIIDSKNIDRKLFVRLADFTIVVGLEFDPIDVESADRQMIDARWSEMIRNLPGGIQIRFLYNRVLSKSGFKGNSRDEALKELSHLEHRGCLFFEIAPSPMVGIFEFFKTFFKKMNSLELACFNFNEKLSNLSFHNLGVHFNWIQDIEFYKRHFNSAAQHSRISGHFMIENDYVGILKLTDQVTSTVSTDLFAKFKNLPFDFEYSITLNKLSEFESETLLKRRLTQRSIGNDHKDAIAHGNLQTALTEVSYNKKILNVEAHFIIRDPNIREVAENAKTIRQSFLPLAIFTRENFGHYESYQATRIGSKQHVPILEKEGVALCYCPLYTFGTSLRTSTKSSLILHRLDGSLGGFDVFNPGFDSFSCVIFGNPGTGKSVLTNMITRSLHHDPNICIYKIDVGGSHSRETQILGGEEIEFLIDSPSGFNPFQMLRRNPNDSEIIQILATFLEVLIREEGEHKISKSMKSDLESALSQYSGSIQEGSITEFYDCLKSQIPRNQILRRWTDYGVFKNAFKTTPEINRMNSSARLKYFNFKKISQALDGDFAQGGLAAVMADYNFSILFNRQNRRFCFIADETPVFIQRSFEFFALSIANIRKYGDGFITICQRSQHAVVGGDTTIIDLSPSRFIFSIDGDLENFQNRFKFTDNEMKYIESLTRKQGEYSEVFQQDSLGSRIYRIRLSPEEYWSYTSKKEDKEKIEFLLSHKFTLKEAIKCIITS